MTAAIPSPDPGAGAPRQGGPREAIRVLRRLLLLAVACAGTACEAVADVDTFRRIVPSVLRVQTARTSGGTGIGTAVVIDRGLAVTNCHVTRDANTIFLVRGQERWAVTAQHVQPQRDVCVLRAPKLDAPSVPVASSLGLDVGEPVMAVGYSLGVGVQFTEGEVVGRHALDGGAVIQSDAPFTSGASGGGLFDARGRLVGLLTFRLPVRGAYYFSLPTEWLAAAMEAGTEYPPVVPLPGARSFWESAPAQWPYFLRAASLEAAGQWTQLLELTGLWLETEPDSDDAKNFRNRARSAAQ